MDRQGSAKEQLEDNGELQASKRPKYPNDLKTIRLQRGYLRSSHFAKYLGVSPSTFSDWEKGECIPQKETRKAICQRLNRQDIEIWPTLNEELSERKERKRSLQRKKATSTKGTKAASTQPLIWDVPHLRNIYFTGREDILTNLHKTFSEKKTVALTQSQAVSGLGGIGKTQIALEYAHRYSTEYKAILWVRAESSEILTSDFVALASLLGLPEREDSDLEEVIAAVKRWLQSNTEWLLIFDNVSDIKAVLKFASTQQTGHILLTTRSQISGENIKHVEVKKMKLEEGILLLLRRAMIIAENAPLEDASDTDRNDAEEIYKLVDGLPLALAHAGAFIAETQCGISRYIELYRKRPLEILSVPAELTDYPYSVLTTWSLNFERVEYANSVAADLLRLFAFLAPDAIPEELLTESASLLGAALEPLAGNPLALDLALKELLKYSLIWRNNKIKTCAIHRLVQTILQYRMDTATQRQWAERAIRATNNCFPEATVENWPQCQRYLPHALVCTSYIKQWEMKFAEAGRLLHETGVYLYEQAQYTQAASLLQGALAIRKHNYGTRHPEVANTLSRLADLYQAQDKSEEGLNRVLKLREQVLNIRKNTLGESHPDVAESLNNLATVYHDLGDFSQAEHFYQQALLTTKKALGSEHPNIINRLSNIANLYRSWGKYDEGISYAEEALKISIKMLGLNDLRTAISFNSLGTLYQIIGKYIEAKKLYEQALAIRQGVLGKDHPEVAQSMANVAVGYYYLGQYVQAESLLQQALDIDERVLGSEHPEVYYRLANLGAVYLAQKKYIKAEVTDLRALAILEKVFGKDHPDKVPLFNYLADLYLSQDKYLLAEQYLTQALTIHKRLEDQKSVRYATTLYHMGRFYLAQEEYTQAENAFQQSLKIRENVLGRKHSGVTQSLDILAKLYTDQGRYNEAEELFTRAIAIYEGMREANSLDLAPYLEAFADLLEHYVIFLQKTNWNDEATAREEQAEMIRDKIAKETSM